MLVGNRAQARDMTAPSLGRPALTALSLGQGGEGPSVVHSRLRKHSLLPLLLETPQHSLPGRLLECFFLPPSERHLPRLPPSIVQGPEENQEVKLGETESYMDLPRSHIVVGHSASR